MTEAFATAAARDTFDAADIGRAFELHGDADRATAGVDMATVLQREAPLLLATARALTLDDAEAHDLVQATAETALRNAHQLRDPAAVRAWLVTIETRQAFRVTRRLRRLVRYDAAILELPVRDAVDERLVVREALARLSPRVRAAVVLHHMVGLTVAEVATALSVSQNTVKTQLRTGMARLRELLSDE